MARRSRLVATVTAGLMLTGAEAFDTTHLYPESIHSWLARERAVATRHLGELSLGGSQAITPSGPEVTMPPSEVEGTAVSTLPADAGNVFSWRTDDSAHGRPLHATMFYVGKGPDGEESGSWDDNWYKTFGRDDTPDARCPGTYIAPPCDRQPNGQSFYVALPLSGGRYRSEIRKAIPFSDGTIHPLWVMVRSKSGKIAFAQVEDSGPHAINEVKYVLHGGQQKDSDGIDLSPAVAMYLGYKDLRQLTVPVDWRFVDLRTEQIKPGPWLENPDPVPGANAS